MQSHVEFVKTAICGEEMAVQYLRKRNLLDDPEEAVINCDKCGSVMQNKSRLIRGNSVPVMNVQEKDSK
jgi:DNA-directed RNA polymerase subunit M/transcription elongation factor TFIIS